MGMTLNDVFDALCDDQQIIQTFGGKELVLPHVKMMLAGTPPVLSAHDVNGTHISVRTSPSINALIQIDTAYLQEYLDRWTMLPIKKEFARDADHHGYLMKTFYGFTEGQVERLLRETYGIRRGS